MRHRLSTLLTLTLTASALLWAVPAAEAQSPYRPYDEPNQFRLRLGVFEPDGDGDYWDAKQFDFTGDPGDLEDVIGGADYLRRVGDHWTAVFSFTGYSGETDQEYLDFVEANSIPIVHTTTLDIATVSIGLNYLFGGPSARFRPYVGAGVGAYAWELTEDGDFVDFATPDLEIFSGTFLDDGVAGGFYYTAGLDIALTQTLDLIAEGRWHNADDELGGDLDGACVVFGTRDCKLDLGGRELTVGLAWRF